MKKGLEMKISLSLFCIVNSVVESVRINMWLCLWFAVFNLTNKPISILCPLCISKNCT